MAALAALLLLPAPALLAPQYAQYPQYPATYYPRAYSSPQTFNYPAYGQQSYQQTYPSHYTYSYPTYTQPQQQQQQPARRYSYPAYQPAKPVRQAYQDPVFNYMLNELSYFGPEVARPSRASSPAAPEAGRGAWQGKVGGRGVTRCHDGTLLAFRARCNEQVECSGGEDEHDCDWHKRSTVETVTSVRGLERVLREEQNVLVEFFAPWCPACVTFLPHLERLKAANSDLPLKVVKVNTDEDPELKKLFSVDSFPRVMLWSKRWGEGPTYMYGQHRTYQKGWGMTYQGIQAWLSSQL